MLGKNQIGTPQRALEANNQVDEQAQADMPCADPPYKMMETWADIAMLELIPTDAINWRSKSHLAMASQPIRKILKQVDCRDQLGAISTKPS